MKDSKAELLQWEIERVFNSTGQSIQSLIEELLLEQLKQIKLGEKSWK